MLQGLRTPSTVEDRTPRRRGTRRVWGCTTREWGDMSTLGSASSHRLRSSHLICPPVAPHDDNMVVIVPCGDR
jgi:hypothetical protein